MADENEGANNTDKDVPVAKTFTQDDINRVAAREKDEGKRAAEKTIADKLGVTIDEAAELIKKARDADESQKTEAQKAKDAADKAKAAADEEKAAAVRERHEARIERVLARAGVDDKKLDRVARMLDVDEGADAEVIAKAAEELKEEFPELFGEASPGTKKPPSSDPQGNPAKPTVNEDAFTRGAERAKQLSS